MKTSLLLCLISLASCAFFNSIPEAEGQRCLEYYGQWDRVELDFHQAWVCENPGTSTQPLKVLRQDTDVICHDDYLARFCRYPDGSIQPDIWGSGICLMPATSWVLQGTYVPGTIHIHEQSRDLRDSSYIHEMTHLYLNETAGDGDGTHKDPPGPWTERHDAAILVLKATPFTNCEEFSQAVDYVLERGLK